MKLIGASVLVACIPALAAAQPANTPAVPQIAGAYASTWGPMTLSQDGDRVTGMYAYQNGRIDGTLRDRTLTFAWVEDNGAGRGVFLVAADGSLSGTWGSGNSDSSGGPWTAERAEAVAPILGRPSASASRWPMQLRMPFDVYVGGRQLEVGWIGFGVDLGYRASSRWYVGATSDVEMMSLVSLDTMPAPGDSEKPGARLRLGGEVRYYFGDGVGAARVNHGPWVPVPRHTWIGMRGGAETFDGFSTTGEFGDFSLGTSFGLGGTSIGMYGAFGVSRQPSIGTAYGGTLGMVVAFGG
jgi:hypothetical protein